MIALLFVVCAAVAQPLSLAEVMDAVDARVPALAAAEAKLLEAEGKLLSSQGAFDPKVVGKARGYTGKDPRTYADTYVQLPTALGPTIEAGYRWGQGDFPAYDGWSETAEDGELRLGVTVPLLNGLGMGEDRAVQKDSRLAMQGASADLADKRIAARRKAEEAWWKWAGAGAKRVVAEQQLALAEQRDAALRAEVTVGARALLQQLDNERVLFERRAALARADQELAVAALVLSLWYRDDLGRPVVPGVERLPLLTSPEVSDRDVDLDTRAAQQRPDLQALEAHVSRHEVRLSRAHNGVLPQLDGRFEGRQDLKDEPTEWIGGVELTFPVLLRKGRGERDRAAAALTRVQETLRGSRDQVGADVAALHEARQGAREWVDWSAQTARRAEEVLELELHSWELGASDLWLLLQREDQLAKARKELVDAQLNLALADVALRATTGGS